MQMPLCVSAECLSATFTRSGGTSWRCLGAPRSSASTETCTSCAPQLRRIHWKPQRCRRKTARGQAAQGKFWARACSFPVRLRHSFLILESYIRVLCRELISDWHLPATKSAQKCESLICPGKVADLLQLQGPNQAAEAPWQLLVPGLRVLSHGAKLAQTCCSMSEPSLASLMALAR